MKITQIEEAYVSEFTEKTKWGKNVHFFVNLFKTFDRVTAFPFQHKNDFNPKRKNMVNSKMIITFYQNNADALTSLNEPKTPCIPLFSIYFEVKLMFIIHDISIFLVYEN